MCVWQGEGLKIFYNPGTTKLTPNEQFGIAFNGSQSKLNTLLIPLSVKVPWTRLNNLIG